MVSSSLTLNFRTNFFKKFSYFRMILPATAEDCSNDLFLGISSRQKCFANIRMLALVQAWKILNSFGARHYFRLSPWPLLRWVDEFNEVGLRYFIQFRLFFPWYHHFQLCFHPKTLSESSLPFRSFQRQWLWRRSPWKAWFALSMSGQVVAFRLTQKLRFLTS